MTGLLLQALGQHPRSEQQFPEMMLSTAVRPALPARPAGSPHMALSVAPRSVPPVRLAALSIVMQAPKRASKVLAVAREGSGSTGPLPYSEALLQREYELWQRQSEMFDRLQEQHAADLARFAAERQAWQASEAALRAEAAELRAQLMYVMAQLGAAQAAAGGPIVGAAGPAAAAYSAASQAAIAGREPAGALPSSGAAFASPVPSSSSSSSASSPAVGSGLSPGEQVKAVVDAMKAGAGVGSGAGSPAPGAPLTPAPTSLSSSPVSPSQAWPAGADQEIPAYAADLAAAVAAVDSSDVLSGVSSYSLQAHRAAAPVPAAAAAPAAAPPPAPVAPPQAQPPAQEPAAAAAPAQAAASPAGAAAVEQEEGAAKGDMAAELAARGPPPPLVLGADDIFWVNQLHTGLVDLGYYPGDEDIDDFFFGEGTQSALMTMQCCEGLPETGIADEATWAHLLGPALTPKASRDLTADMMINVPGLSALGGSSKAADASSGTSSAQQQEGEQQAAAKPYAELFTAAFSETVGPAPGGGIQDVQQLTVSDTVAVGDQVVSETVQISTTVTENEVSYTEWPVLHEGDGGREVHALQVALTRAGYYPSEDDERWWSFGDGTLAALKTFQACSGYPESGVCDAATWRLLLGDDAHPSMILELRSGDSADEDLAAESSDRVWLIGEQRWEDRSRLKKGK